MDILNTVSLQSNTQVKNNLDGGGLSSDAGLLLYKRILLQERCGQTGKAPVSHR